VSSWDSARAGLCSSISVIYNEVKGNEVVLFMKARPQFPMCGFSGQVVQMLPDLAVAYNGLTVLENDELRQGKDLFRLANYPTALHPRRVCGRL
jgi:glutaredoxin-related protein